MLAAALLVSDHIDVLRAKDVANPRSKIVERQQSPVVCRALALLVPSRSIEQPESGPKLAECVCLLLACLGISERRSLGTSRRD
jgi:hypothetical protein